MEQKRISESELIIPALNLISLSNQGVSTTELIKKLEEIMNPQGKDAEIISGRNDTYFSQKVRNITAHKTLINKNWAEYRDGLYYITKIGEKFLDEKKEIFDYLQNTDFSQEEKETTVKNMLDENVFYIPEIDICEGELVTVSSQTRRRSSVLRNFAFDYFKTRNLIKCDVCEFDFEQKYGKLGIGYIELHHIRPIELYEKEGQIIKLEKAINNLVPLCSNCHKMIHKNKIEVQEFKRIINT